MKTTFTCSCCRLLLALLGPAMLNAQNFQPLPGGGLGAKGRVFAFAHEASSGRLYVGGSFSIISGTLASNVAVWGNNVWQPLGDGLDNAPTCLAIGDGEVYAAGFFRKNGSQDVGGTARWDGQQWHPLGSGLNAGASVNGLVWFRDQLWVGGQINTAGGQPVHSLAVWDGTAWNAAAAPDFLYVRGLRAYGDSLLVVWGGVTTPDHYSVPMAALFNGTNWTTLPALPDDDGTFQAIWWNYQMLATQNERIYRLEDNNWNLVLTHTTDIEKLDATSEAVFFADRYAKTWRWQPDGALENIGQLADETADVLFGAGAQLWVGGYFSAVQGLPAAGLARYSDGQWSVPGQAGFERGGWGYCAFRDTTGDLWVGGEFRFAGPVPAFDIARWDGQQWHALGEGLSGRVRKIFRYQGQLYAIGNFTRSGQSPCPYLARWDGNVWAPAGPDSLNGIVRDALEWNGALYIAGEFTRVGDQQGYNMARFDGATWTPVGPVATAYTLPIDALELFDGAMWAAVRNQGIRRFSDANTWTDAGIFAQVNDLIAYDGALWAAASDGIFRYAGGQQWENMQAPSPARHEFYWRFSSIENQLFVAESSKGIWRYANGEWSLFDTWTVLNAVVQPNGLYWLVGQERGQYVDGEYRPISGVGELTFLPPAVTATASADTICPRQYVFYQTESATVTSAMYTWELPGSLPDISTRHNPIAQYLTPGNFTPSLQVSTPTASATVGIAAPLVVSGSCILAATPRPDNVWLLGNNYQDGYTAGIDFSYDQPDRAGWVIPDSLVPAYYANASICDDEGRLLFYTNGITVANGRHQVIPGSEGFDTGWSWDPVHYTQVQILEHHQEELSAM